MLYSKHICFSCVHLGRLYNVFRHPEKGNFFLVCYILCLNHYYMTALRLAGGVAPFSWIFVHSVTF